MDSYRPLITKKGLKKLCKKAMATFDTPLEQARTVIQEISELRNKKLIRYEGDEWQDEPSNKPYMNISREFHKSSALKAKKKKKGVKND